MKSQIWEDTGGFFSFMDLVDWALRNSATGIQTWTSLRTWGCGDLPAIWAWVVRMGHLRTHLAAKKNKLIFTCSGVSAIISYPFGVSSVLWNKVWDGLRSPGEYHRHRKLAAEGVLRPQLANASEHCIEKLSNSNWLVTRSTRIWEKILAAEG